MTSLHDRLADLAEHAPAGAPPDASSGDDLWQRGRRYGRRRRLETLTLTLVLLAAVGSLVGALLPATTYDVGPADAQAGLRLPDRLQVPSPWAPGTDDVGELGPLAAVVPAERRTWSSTSTGVAGVSTDGDYAFLDLPGLSSGRGLQEGARVALSADGRHVAYPLAGTPAGEPNRMDGDTFVGVAIYDTVTGEVDRHQVETEHGIDVSGLVWAGDTLWLQYGQWDQAADEGAETGTGSDYLLYTWPLGQRPRRFDGPRPDLLPQAGLPTRVVAPGARLEVYDGDGTALSRVLRPDVRPESAAVLNPSGTRVAVLGDPDGDPGTRSSDASPLLAGVVPAGPDVDVTTEPVDDVRADDIWGWRDDWTVVVRAYSANALLSVDVNTGATERLVRLPQDGSSSEVVVAQDALAAPTFSAPDAPYVLDPRLRLALVVLGVLLAGLGIVLWRRRGRV
ncbi:hypothetical protein [Nocardioides lijunqiniae]|uniref:hypothetical protein n=1 Tax=Nocardioides lijunqiniae TaxID=2760832 RepID=UPI0018789E97|nr:hypothetical protein [Nocardioides lijunqiniae]